MNLPNSRSYRFGRLAAPALLLAALAAQANAVDVLYSGTSEDDDAAVLDLITGSFRNVNLTYGDFSDYAANAAEIEAADVFFVGRRLSSAGYANAANSASFNALTIPVVSFTSYVSRSNTDRWGWHDGSVSVSDASGAESTVTAAGAAIFGIAEGDYDFLESPDNFNAFGLGNVGDGDILAQASDGRLVSVGWDAGDLSATGVAFGGDRLLWNLHESGATSNDTILPTAAGTSALLLAIAEYTGLELALPGDVDDDGFVDLTDYGIIRDNFGMSPATKGDGDLVADDIVDLNDFLNWRSNYTPAGAAAGSQNVPEPTALLLSALGLACTGSRRKRH